MVEEHTEKPSTSSAPKPSKEELDAFCEILSAGKRHLICNEPDRALELFVDLCEQLSNIYGQDADECAEAYLYYGKTLLELARLENGVLGHAVKETPILGMDDDDTENEKTDDKTEDKAEAAEPTENTESEAKGEGEQEGVGEEHDDCGDQDVTNMELSWEMLELTSAICTRMLTEENKDKKKANEMLCEAKYALAQISMEQEQYERAVTDFKTCLEMQTEQFEDKLDRRLAEVHYNIGLAYSFDKKFDEAITSFKEAVSILEARKERLLEKVKKAEETNGKEKAPTELNEWNKEIKELEDLIVLDMNAKIEDAEEMKRQSDLAIKAMKEATKEMFSAASGFESGFGFDAPSDGQEEVNDITSQIRSSKRKSDDDDSSVETKKVKTTVNENNGVSNGKLNGTEPEEQKPTSIGA